MIDKITKMYEAEYDKLVKICVGRGVKGQDAEDTVQEAFTRAITYVDSFDSSRLLGAWFNTILNNAIRDKKKEVRNDGMVRDSDIDEFCDEGDAEFDKALADALSKEIEGRVPAHRNVLYLYFVRGYTPRAICKVVEENAQNVYKIIGRFKKEMEVKYG